MKYRCPRCEFVFTTLQSAKAHINNKNPCQQINDVELAIVNIIEVNEREICIHCKKELRDVYTLNRHMTTCKRKVDKKNDSLRLIVLEREINKLKEQDKHKIRDDNEEIKKLKEELAKVKEEKAKEKRPTDKGFIYLIHELKDKNSGDNIYKFGYTVRSFEERLADYHKGTTIIFVTKVKNPFKVEQELIKVLSNKFEVDRGKEYFKGDEEEICSVIMQHIAKMNSDDSDDSEKDFTDLNELD